VNCLRQGIYCIKNFARFHPIIHIAPFQTPSVCLLFVVVDDTCQATKKYMFSERCSEGSLKLKCGVRVQIQKSINIRPSPYNFA
jgi:hypothetical protein